MNMLSTQIDNLRLMARLVRDYDYAEISRMLREAADTITSLWNSLTASEAALAELGSGTCEKDQLEAALALSRGMVDMATRRELYKDNRIADLEQLVRDMYDVAARGEFDVGEESKFSERMTKLGVVDEC